MCRSHSQPVKNTISLWPGLTVIKIIMIFLFFFYWISQLLKLKGSTPLYSPQHPLYFQIHQKCSQHQVCDVTPAVSVRGYSMLPPNWPDTRESTLERNLTVVRSVGNHLHRKRIVKFTRWRCTIMLKLKMRKWTEWLESNWSAWWK